ncbi:Type III PLP / low-specificity D-threonine aldolase [Planctomycetales bacterium 10988]|nr:Type III PLP / low-specificity D-threonine aldolase [Planctomycetales bacterium 10988]
MDSTWYTLREEDSILSPALLIYPHRVWTNIVRMLKITDGPERLRPHVKTHKMAEVVSMQLASGIRKFKAATIAEAEMLAGTGAEDVLLAYPLVGPNLDRFVALQQQFPQVIFQAVVDHAEVLELMSECFSYHGLEIPTLVDLDLGLQRTGCSLEEAYALYQAIAELPGIFPGGLHAYDGHLSQRDYEERKAAVMEVYQPVTELKERLIAEGFEVPAFVCGGSPTFAIHAEYPDRECSPGTCVLWDAGYQHLAEEVPFEPAIALFTRVVSRPGRNLLCLDLGTKSLSTDSAERVQFPDYPDAKIVHHYEEHMVIELPGADQIALGKALYGIPWHVCPTVALFEEATVVEDGIARGTWQVLARRRKITV